ncbi:MAG: hypothetical protein AAF806_31770, partial [Bacteroidota bacterium]
QLVGVRVYSYESSEEASLYFESSHNGVSYQRIPSTVKEYKSAEKNYAYLTPRLYTISLEQLKGRIPIDFIKFIRLKMQDEVNIVRVEIDYK